MALNIFKHYDHNKTDLRTFLDLTESFWMAFFAAR